MEIQSHPFAKVLKDVTRKFSKIKKSDYLKKGEFRIIDQGKEFLAGYTDDAALLTDYGKPLIIFGDHTKIFKYVDFPFAIGADGVKVLEVNDSIAEVDYVFNYLKTIKLHSGGYSRHFKYLKEIQIPLPKSKEYQKRIAQILSRTESLIRQREESIILADEFVKHTFLKMFGKSEEFSLKPIIQIASDRKYALSSGPFGSNLTSKHYTEKGVVVLRGKNITTGKLDLSDVKYISHDKAEELKRSEIHPGDVVVVAVGSSGQALKIPESLPKAIMSQNFNKITANTDEVNPTYLTSVLNSQFVQSQFKKEMSDGGRSFLGLTTIKNILIPVPNIQLQNKYDLVVKQAESLKDHYLSSLEKLNKLLISLRSNAFKGELSFFKYNGIADSSHPPAEGRSNILNERGETLDREKNLELPKTFKDGKGSGQNFYESDLAKIIRRHFTGFHFTFQELINHLEQEEGWSNIIYLTSEEEKLSGADVTNDIKSFIYDALQGRSEDLHLQQWYYDANDSVAQEIFRPKEGESEKAKRPAGIYLKVVQ